jgi:NRPS condensation-like uncharacterized protein
MSGRATPSSESRVPFTPTELVVSHVERTTAPWNIQFELASHGPLAPERLQQAVRTAVAHHPLAGAVHRRAPDSPTGHAWVVVDDPAVDLRTTTAGALDEFRGAFYGERLDLSTAPPFRVALARGAGPGDGDRVLFCTSHVPMDGVGTLALVRSVCLAYRGESLATPSVPLAATRETVERFGSRGVRARLVRAGETASRLRTAFTDPPSRLAPAGTDDDGWGFHHRTLGPALTERLLGGRPPGVSVNDAVLAALSLAVDDWNAAHDRTTDRVGLMVPVNARPADRFYETVAMYTPFVSVSTDRAARATPGSTLRAVARRTDRVRERDSAAWVADALGLFGPVLPAVAARGVPWLLDRTDRALLDTAVCSNLGRVPAFPGFDAERPAGLWFSPPTVMPMGAGLGVATLDGRVSLTLRYAREQFDAAGATRFTDGLCTRLGDVV